MIYLKNEDVVAKVKCHCASILILVGKSLEKYEKVSGTLGEKLRKSLVKEEEEEFFEWRKKLFEFVQNRAVLLDTRLRILYDVGITDEIVLLYQSLECLDKAWHEKLKNISNNNNFYGFDVAFEQLLK